MSVQQRILKNVDKTNSCWLWKGSKYCDGYARLEINGGKKREFVHRVVYESFFPPLKKHENVYRACGNRHVAKKIILK